MIGLISKIIGGSQCGAGIAMSILAYIVYSQQGIKDALAITQNETSLIAFLLLFFGVFMILSGLSLALNNKNEKTAERWHTLKV